MDDQTPDDVSTNQPGTPIPGQGRARHGARRCDRGPGHCRHDGLHSEANGKSLVKDPEVMDYQAADGDVGGFAVLARRGAAVGVVAVSLS